MPTGIFHNFGAFFPNDFTDEEIEFAKSRGVKFEGQTIVCPRCKSIRQRSMVRRSRRF